MRETLEDRAFDMSWWQLCPEIAYQVKVLRRGLPNTNDSDTGNGEARKWSKLGCPEEAAVEEVAEQLQKEAEEWQEALAGRGQGLKAAQVAVQPNKYRTLAQLAADPAALSRFLAQNCSSQEIGGPSTQGQLDKFHFGWYTGDWFNNHIRGNTFEACVDGRGLYDAFRRAENAKEEQCRTPFEKQGAVCYAYVVQSTPWCPTSTQCAASLSSLYKVPAQYLRGVLEILRDVDTTCSAFQTEETCLEAPSAPYKNFLEVVYDSIPGRPQA